MIIKVCGMKEGDNIHQVEALGVDFVGFIFYPRSPRFVEVCPDYLPERAKRVGVFVNADIDTICNHIEQYALDFVQLHGKESPEYCRRLRQETTAGILKAFPIAIQQDLEITTQYEGICDYYLFDTKTDAYGGSGKRFDWNILQHYQGKSPFLLSGGIDPDCTTELTKFRHIMLAGYDLNSRFEVSPGIKDPEVLKSFIEQINSL